MTNNSKYKAKTISSHWPVVPGSRAWVGPQGGLSFCPCLAEHWRDIGRTRSGLAHVASDSQRQMSPAVSRPARWTHSGCLFLFSLSLAANKSNLDIRSRLCTDNYSQRPLSTLFSSATNADSHRRAHPRTHTRRADGWRAGWGRLAASGWGRITTRLSYCIVVSTMILVGSLDCLESRGVINRLRLSGCLFISLKLLWIVILLISCLPTLSFAHCPAIFYPFPCVYYRGQRSGLLGIDHVKDVPDMLQLLPCNCSCFLPLLFNTYDITVPSLFVPGL